MRWEPSAEGVADGIGQGLQLQIKRARLRVEILKHESDPKAKFELFQRLNTGGASLSEQEIRNCVAVMLNKELYDWLLEMSELPDFVSTVSQTQTAIDAQASVELVLRLISFRKVPYVRGLDVHEYLDRAIMEISTDEQIDMAQERETFERTFQVLNEALGPDAFKRWDGTAFKGKFLMSVFEVLAHGTASNISALWEMDEDDRKVFLLEKAKELWADRTFQDNSGGGVRGTTRLVNLLPMAAGYLNPQT